MKGYEKGNFIGPTVVSNVTVSVAKFKSLPCINTLPSGLLAAIKRKTSSLNSILRLSSSPGWKFSGSEVEFLVLQSGRTSKMELTSWKNLRNI